MHLKLRDQHKNYCWRQYFSEKVTTNIVLIHSQFNYLKPLPAFFYVSHMSLADLNKCCIIIKLRSIEFPCISHMMLSSNINYSWKVIEKSINSSFALANTVHTTACISRLSHLLNKAFF